MGDQISEWLRGRHMIACHLGQGGRITPTSCLVQQSRARLHPAEREQCYTCSESVLGPFPANIFRSGHCDVCGIKLLSYHMRRCSQHRRRFVVWVEGSRVRGGLQSVDTAVDNDCDGLPDAVRFAEGALGQETKRYRIAARWPGEAPEKSSHVAAVFDFVAILTCAALFVGGMAWRAVRKWRKR